jgi:hypothetical protein
MRRPQGKDERKTESSLETKGGSVGNPFDLCFPPELRGKRVSLKLSEADKNEIGPDSDTLKRLAEHFKGAEELLNDYLNKGNLESLFKACRNNVELFTLSFDRPKSTAEAEYVDPKEIFWTTVTYWTNLTRTSPRNINKAAKDNLGKLGGRVFAAKAGMSVIRFDSYGLSHKKPYDKKAARAGFDVVRPLEFKARFDEIRATFKAELKKTRRPEDEAAKRIIREVLKDDDFTDSQISEIDFYDYASMAASYIGIKHAQECAHCTEAPKPSTIQKQYRSACKQVKARRSALKPLKEKA